MDLKICLFFLRLVPCDQSDSKQDTSGPMASWLVAVEPVANELAVNRQETRVPGPSEPVTSESGPIEPMACGPAVSESVSQWLEIQ